MKPKVYCRICGVSKKTGHKTKNDKDKCWKKHWEKYRMSKSFWAVRKTLSCGAQEKEAKKCFSCGEQGTERVMRPDKKGKIKLVWGCSVCVSLRGE